MCHPHSASPFPRAFVDNQSGDRIVIAVPEKKRIFKTVSDKLQYTEKNLRSSREIPLREQMKI